MESFIDATAYNALDCSSGVLECFRRLEQPFTGDADRAVVDFENALGLFVHAELKEVIARPQYGHERSRGWYGTGARNVDDSLPEHLDSDTVILNAYKASRRDERAEDYKATIVLPTLDWSDVTTATAKQAEAVRMLAEGCTFREIGEALGHRDEQTTRRLIERILANPVNRQKFRVQKLHAEGESIGDIADELGITRREVAVFLTR